MDIKNNTTDRPQPKPRHQVNIIDCPKPTAYENVSLDLLDKKINVNNDNLQNNRRVKQDNHKELLPPIYPTIVNQLNDQKKPIPAPRRNARPTESAYQNVQVQESGSLVTRIQTKSNVSPPKLQKVNEKNIDSMGSLNQLDRSKSNSSINSSISGTSDQTSKYLTTSPTDLLKSLGETSKMLTESITERVTVRAKGARHKMDKIQKSSQSKLIHLRTDATLRLKNVRDRIGVGGNLPFGRAQGKETREHEVSDDGVHMEPTNDTIFQSIQFHSPLNKTVKVNDLIDTKPEGSYAVPKYRYERESVYSEPYGGDSESDDPSFHRNTQKTRSLYEPDVNEKLRKDPIKDSDTTIYANTVPRKNKPINLERDSYGEGLPCPSYPPPTLLREGLYGHVTRIRHDSSTESEKSDYPSIQPPSRQRRNKPINDPEKIELRRREMEQNDLLASQSNRATVDSIEFSSRGNKIFSRDVYGQNNELTGLDVKKKKYLPSSNYDRSDSWSYQEIDDTEQQSMDNSSPEPIYANNDTGRSGDLMSEQSYGAVCQMNTSNADLLAPSTTQPKPLRTDISPPPSPSYCPTVDLINLSVDNILQEFDPLVSTAVDRIFSEKSNKLILLENLLGDGIYNPSVDDPNCEDDDHDSIEQDIPVPSERSDSLPGYDENMNPPPQQQRDGNRTIQTVESVVEQYLSRTEDVDGQQSDIDMRRPKQSATNWFVDETVEGGSSSSEPPPTNNLNKCPEKKEINCDPPSYNEAIGLTVPDDGKTSKPTMKSMFNTVLNRMEGMNLSIKRRPSFKTSNQQKTKVILERIPKPPINNHRLILHEGHLIKIPSGVTRDLLKELQSRKAYIRDRRFIAYSDKDLKIPKENLGFEHFTTIQCVNNHKFTNNSMDIHCFEITVAIAKNPPNTLNNPNMVLTNTDNGNSKLQRMCYLYGLAKETERYIWMQKLLESMTNVFPTAFTSKFYRAGWCYLKNSITSQWSGAWILLQKQKRKLLFYSIIDLNLECMDLRKARCLVLKECDDSIKNLHVETGPMMMIDCPPYAMYFIMSSPRETKVWRHIIEEVAHNNGPSLKEQQLTKYDVPVLVDKCINFIYAHGSMSEGIYRKSGAENSIQKLLQQFRIDAFSVQMTRNTYTEHDVSNALKRFMRDLPDRLLGKFSESFICVAAMTPRRERIVAYKELLTRLPAIEYQTLKKLIGHLNFIQSLKPRNKMGPDNLAMIWGPTLLQNKNTEMQYSQKEADVIIDLIAFYKHLYAFSAEELTREQIMLTVLKKYHSAAESLSDSVKQSGDLKVWITIDSGSEAGTDEKQINVTLTPHKTVLDVCKELAPQLNKTVTDVSLHEIIVDGTLQRPLHFTEKLLDVVLNWSYWPEADRKNNCLQLKLAKFLREVDRTIKLLPAIQLNRELKYADPKSKSLKSYTLDMMDDRVTVMKKEKTNVIQVRELDLKNLTIYLGCERKRDLQMRWAITMIERVEPNQQILRTRDAPYIGHVIAGTNSNDQLIWYTSIYHSLYGDRVFPNPEIILD